MGLNYHPLGVLASYARLSLMHPRADQNSHRITNDMTANNHGVHAVRGS